MSLDDTLAAWAATVRLPDAAAEGIYQQIVTTQTSAAGVPGGFAGSFGGLGRTWWRDFTADFATRMVASTRPVPVSWAA
jgi:hypothetical protein